VAWRGKGKMDQAAGVKKNSGKTGLHCRLDGEQGGRSRWNSKQGGEKGDGSRSKKEFEV